MTARNPVHLPSGIELTRVVVRCGAVVTYAARREKALYRVHEFAPIDVARQAVRDPVVTRKVRNSEPQRATTDFARQLLKVAQLKHAAGDWASAEDAYRKAIAKDTRCVECLEGLAQVLVAQNRKTEAVSYYEQAKAAETMKALKQ